MTQTCLSRLALAVSLVRQLHMVVKMGCFRERSVVFRKIKRSQLATQFKIHEPG